MLYTIAVVLLILWLLGLVTSYTMGGFIHILLVIALVVVLLRVISGRSAVWVLMRGRIPDKTSTAMWCYAVALFGIIVIAEAMGLGGIPAQAVEIENILFIVLLAAFVVMAFKEVMRR